MRIHRLGRLLAGTVLLAALPAIPAPASRPPSWLPVVEIARGGGTRGPWRQNDSHYDYVDDATAVFLPGGALAVAWVDQRRKEVLLRVLDANGKPRGEPVDVSRSPATFSWMPRLASGEEGALHVLWQEIIFSGGSHGGDILFARSPDGGRTFSTPLNLSASRGGDGKGRLTRDIWSNGSLGIAAGPNGSVIAAWTEYDGALWLARSRNKGGSFTAPQRIAGTASSPARGPALAVADGGQVYLAWTVGEDADADIRVARSRDGGATFGPPVLLGAPAARADAPRLVLGRGGRLHLAYMEQAGKGAPAIRYARAGTDLRFGAVRTLSTPGKGATAPQLAVDGQGRVHLTWEQVDRKGMWHVVDAGAGFSDPSSIPGSGDAHGRSGSQQGILGNKLAAGRDGAIAVVDSSLAQGRGSRVRLMRAQDVR
jgi:hypothetical protein